MGPDLGPRIPSIFVLFLDYLLAGVASFRVLDNQTLGHRILVLQRDQLRHVRRRLLLEAWQILHRRVQVRLVSLFEASCLLLAELCRLNITKVRYPLRDRKPERFLMVTVGHQILAHLPSYHDWHYRGVKVSHVVLSPLIIILSVHFLVLRLVFVI